MGVNLYVMFEWMGGLGIILGLFVFPVMLLGAPWYALFAMDWALPLLLTYVPFIAIGVLSALTGDE
ncbi:MAG: hypothetical protein IH867_01875 [Chloroflexi bacterium]|nr:hypothetical protein [Chloroflexota bacterium]